MLVGLGRGEYFGNGGGAGRGVEKVGKKTEERGRVAVKEKLSPHLGGVLTCGAFGRRELRHGNFVT